MKNYYMFQIAMIFVAILLFAFTNTSAKQISQVPTPTPGIAVHQPDVHPTTIVPMPVDTTSYGPILGQVVVLLTLTLSTIAMLYKQSADAKAALAQASLQHQSSLEMAKLQHENNMADRREQAMRNAAEVREKLEAQTKEVRAETAGVMDSQTKELKSAIELHTEKAANKAEAAYKESNGLNAKMESLHTENKMILGVLAQVVETLKANGVTIKPVDPATND